MIQQLISDERFTNIQKAQAGLTKLFKKAEKSGYFYTVLKNDQPLGVLLPRKKWEGLIEDWEALASLNYLKRIAESRRSKRVSAVKIKTLLKT